MGKRKDIPDNGSWPYAEELFQRGDPAFVDELRRITDCDRLGGFAITWFMDGRPEARQLLLAYLTKPLNSFRHEALVKRLFKAAEQAGDALVMAHFLVALDRSVRRRQSKRRNYESAHFSSKAEAEARARSWEEQGMTVHTNQYGNSFYVSGISTEDTIRVQAGSTIWRPGGPKKKPPGAYPVEEWFRQQQEKCFLFSLSTRRYLRRRVWRFFRRLGRQQPDRYVPAVVRALKLYTDADVADGLALIDCWALVHILFHHSPVLTAKRNGWELAPDRKLSELTPAPAFAKLWQQTPQTYFDLLKVANCRPVRQWAVRMIRQNLAAVLAQVPPERFFALLTSTDPEVVALAAEVLRTVPDLAAFGIDQLLGLLDTSGPDTIDILCLLLAEKLSADRVTLAQAIRLACSRPVPAARLGLGWLRGKSPAGEEECQALLGLAAAQAEPVRPDIIRWARGVLAASALFRPEWVLDFLDSRHADVRAEGWAWLQGDPRVNENVEVWRKLSESPYDDVRLPLIDALDKRIKDRAGPADGAALDADVLRFLWASVLLNIQRGNRTKPLVVSQLVRRVTRRPEEAAPLLPILAAALRSLRGPEFRTGLAGVVLLIEKNPDLVPLVQQTFPELVA